jgi:hypothetical protein
VDSNAFCTEPGLGDNIPNQDFDEIDQSQEGFVEGLFFVRANHPSLQEKHASSTAQNYQVL